MFKGDVLLVNGRARISCLVLLILVFVCTGSARAEDTQEHVRIGVLAKRGAERCMEKWGPTARYLSDNIPGHSFEIVPLGYDKVIPAVERGEVDFVLANPSLYVEAETLYGAGRLVTLKNLRLGCVSTTYGGVVFCRSDRGDIKTLADLKGKTFMAVHKNAFGGWLAAWQEMKEVGIDPHRDFKQLLFEGTHDAVVYAVRDGKVDAGTVRTDTLERMVAEGKIRMEEFRALKHDHIGEEVCEYPFLHSTDLYPEWPFAEVRHTSDELAEQVAVALLGMPANCPAAKVANCAGWTIPANYQPVHECLKELRVGPYKDYGKVTLVQTVRNYWYWLVIIAAALVAMAGATAYVLKLNRRLNQTQLELQNELAERTRVEDALQKSERRLLTLYEATDDAVMLLDEEGFFDCNDATVRIFGCDDRQEFLGRHSGRFSPPRQPDGQDSYTAAKQKIAKAFEEGRNHFEWLHCRKDGTEFPAEVILNRMELDGRDILQAVVRDITVRKRAAEALARSEEKFRTLVEQMPAVTYAATLDETSTTTYVSPQIESFLGVSPDIYMKSPDFWNEHLHPNDRERVLSEMAKCHETNEPFRSEYRMVLQSGDVIWIRDDAVIVRDADGTPLFLQGVMLNITERKRAEEALRESESKYKTLLENLPQRIFCKDRDSVYVSSNENYVHVLKIKPEELPGKTDYDFFPKELAEKYRADDKRIMASGKAEDIEEKFIEDGRETIVHTVKTPIRDEKGNVVGVLGIFWDITEFKQAEEALRESEKTARAILNATQDLALLIEPDGTILAVNEVAATKAFGKAPDELIGMNARDTLPRELAEKRLAQSDKVVRSGKRVRFEDEHDGIWLDHSLYPIFDAEGKVVRLAIFASDITERKRAEEELHRAKEAAEAATRAKSEFLANMSHEIRTPLTAILGYADLIMDPQQNPSERLNCLSVIRRNSEHLLDLINDILDISRIEAGKFTIDPRPCSVPAVVADVVSMMRVRADERGISLSAEYTGQLPETILTDPARLRQGLVNLVGNAVKFTETGGVRLIVSFLPDWRDEKPAVEIKVADTGIGIAPEDLEHLFQPFVQVDASTSRKYGGSGLGLAITRHIVTLMGGELTAESTPGKGSVFSVTIPTGSLEGVGMLQRPAEAVIRQPAESQACSSNVLAGKHILLAEDGEDNMRLIRAILRKAGAEVFVAENGRVAVNQAMDRSFDVILMDIQMPEMDGYQATSYLRSAGYSGPIIALTAHAMVGDCDLCLSAGCDDYLTKPIDRAHLIATVAKHISIDVTGDAEPAEPTRTKADETELIQSRFADEADLAGIIDEFIAGLPARLEAMREAAANGHYERLQRLAHRLKGAGGGYGYPMLTEAAKALEDAAKAGDIEAANLSLKELAVLCEAVARGRGGAGVASEAETDEGPAD